MGSKAKAPKAPDYTALAKQEAELAQEQWGRELQAARPDQENAWGKMTWEQDPTTGEWTQSSTLAPEYEALRQQQAGNQGQLAGLIGSNLGSFDASQIDLSGAPGMPEVGGYDERTIATMRALQAPTLERQRAQKEAKLAAMGLGTGSGAAWNNEQSNIGDQENRADLNAILAGIQEGNTDFGQGMQLHQQGTQDIINQRTANLGQLSGLMGLGQNVTNPQFAGFQTPSAGSKATADLTGAGQAQYGASVDAANAKNAGGNIFGTLAGAAGTAIGGPIGGAIGTGVGKVFGK